MATLSGNKIKDTYQSLVKFSDNGNITTSAKQLTDGFGNNSPMFVSTTQVGIGVTPESGLNLHVFGDAKIGSNLTVIGNLVVEGSTTTVGTDTLTVKDPLIVLANNNTSTDAVDIGFYGKYTPSGTTLYSGLFREALTGKYRLFKGLEDEPTTTVNTSGTGYAVATLVANLEGNVTGNLIGSVTGGTFSGTLSSNVAATTQSANDNSTKVATTAYVDNQVGLYDTLSEVLANGNTSGANDIIMEDGQKVNFGTDSDLEMYHDGTDGYIDNINGELILQNNSDNKKIIFKSDNGIGDITEYFRIDGNINRNVITVTTQLNDDVPLIFGDGAARPSIKYDSTATDLIVSTNGSTALTIDTSQNATFSGTISGVLADGVTATTQSDGDNSTKVATTAYVDTAIEGHDTLAEVLSGGNTTGGTDIAITAGDKITNFTSTGIDDNATSTVLTIDNTNRALFSGDVSLQANLIGNTNATGDLTILGSLFVGDYGVNDDPDYLYADNNIVRIGYYSNAKQFEVNNSDFKVTATHKVGIGTNDPQTLLEVSNENSLLDPVIRLNNVDSSLSDGQNLGSIEFYNDHTSSTTANIGVFHSTDGTIVKEMKFNLGSSGDILTLAANEINATKRFTITGSGSTPRVTLANNVGEGGLTYSLRSTDGGIFGIYKGSTDVLTIDSNGDVGIGTDSAQTKLHLQDEDNALFFTLESSNTTTHKNVAIKYQNYSTGTDFWWTGMDGSGDNMNNFVFNYSQNFDSTVLTLQPNGNVGIGTSSPDRILHINSSNVQIAALIESTSTTSTQLNFKNGSTTNNGGFIKTTGDNIILTANNTSATHLVVASGGNVGIGTTSPDTKLHVSGSSGTAQIKIQRANTNTTGSVGSIGFANDDGYFLTAIETQGDGNDEGGHLIFRTHSDAVSTDDNPYDVTERMRITSDGVVEIRQTSGGELLLYSTDTSLVANQLIGSLGFYKSDASGAGAGVSASIQVRSDSSIGAKSYMAFHTDNGTGSQNAERMRIDSSGNVGIGTTVANGKLHIADTSSSSTTQYFSAASNTATYSYIKHIDNTVNTAKLTLGTVYGYSTPVDAMTIFNGNVGIGITSPTKKLTVFGTGAGNATVQIEGEGGADPYINFLANNAQHWSLGIDDSDSDKFKLSKHSALGTNDYLVVDTSGNVGINETSPDALLDIELTDTNTYDSTALNTATLIAQTFNTSNVNSQASVISLRTTGWAGGTTGVVNLAAIQAGNANSAHFVIQTRNAGTYGERMRITSGGDVCVGTTTGRPDSAADAGVAISPAGKFYIYSTSDFGVYNTNTTGKKIYFRVNEAEKGSIQFNTNSVAYNTTSDYRLKENVVEMTGALDRVSQLKPSQFNFIGDTDTTVDGFLAHEVQEIVPEAISGEKDGMRTKEYEVTPAIYEDVVHPAEEAVYETIEHPAVEEELDDEGNVVVEAVESYTEEVLVKEAKEEWTEKVLVSEAVMGTKEVPEYQGIDQSKLVPLLVGAIQEQQQIINDLKSRIETLENN